MRTLGTASTAPGRLGKQFIYVNTGYVTWAGITAGKAQSFYSFIGGGDNWNNFFSPDHKGFNEPMLLAYTASFGGGFTATLAAQSPGSVRRLRRRHRREWWLCPDQPGAGPRRVQSGPDQYGGQKWPDIVGALHVKQGWGEAQVSGVIHNVNVSDDGNYVPRRRRDCGCPRAFVCNGTRARSAGPSTPA